MATTDAPSLTLLAARDVPGCMTLSAEAGWNQLPDDWTLFLDRGTVFGLLGADGRPAATGAILPYGDEFAWVSMVLVTAARRRHRIGTRILEACCKELTQRGLVAVLDATPAGEPVYRPLGFEPLFGLTRWQGAGGGRSGISAGVRPMREADIAAVIAIDAGGFGARRPFLLEDFFRRAPHLAFVSEDGEGFALARPGRIAAQIGPIVAANEATAAALLGAALDTVNGPVFLDLCDRWKGLAREVERCGLTVQRPFLRMALRHAAPFGDPARTFVVAGPEFG